MKERVTIREFEKAVKAINNSNEYPPDIPTIWDTRQFDFNTFNRDSMDRFFDVCRRYPVNRRAAIVAQSDLSFGMSRMYEILAELFELPQQFQIFRDYSSALQWPALIRMSAD